MANGKGTLNCRWYCKYFNSEKEYCNYHEVILPLPKKEGNCTICCHFEPNENFIEDGIDIWCPLVRKFTWFGIDLEPGVLYEFHYNNPKDIKKTSVLRIPDYKNNSWKK